MAFLFRRGRLFHSNFLNCLSFTTEATVIPKRESSSFRTNKEHPGEHTEKDVGLFYNIPFDLASNRLFKYGGWTQLFMENCMTFNETCLMVRKPGLEIIHYLKNADYSKPINRYVLYGKPGAGKTLTLSYVLHYAFLEEWLIVHIPWAPTWLSDKVEVPNSKLRPEIIDLSVAGRKWLVHFKNQNSEVLTKNHFPIGNNYDWNTRESSKAGDSLLSVVEYGISRASSSCHVINVIFQEIKGLSKAGLVKTLVLIDGFNALFSTEKVFKNVENEKFSVFEMALATDFKNMVVPDWHNGAAILVCDETAVTGFKGQYPHYLLTLKGFEFVFPFLPIEIPFYSDLEVDNTISYYQDRRWLNVNSGLDELKVVTNHNGHDLMRFCSAL